MLSAMALIKKVFLGSAFKKKRKPAKHLQYPTSVDRGRGTVAAPHTQSGFKRMNPLLSKARFNLMNHSFSLTRFGGLKEWQVLQPLVAMRWAVNDCALFVHFPRPRELPQTIQQRLFSWP